MVPSPIPPDSESPAPGRDAERPEILLSGLRKVISLGWRCVLYVVLTPLVVGTVMPLACIAIKLAQIGVKFHGGRDWKVLYILFGAIVVVSVAAQLGKLIEEAIKSPLPENWMAYTWGAAAGAVWFWLKPWTLVL